MLKINKQSFGEFLSDIMRYNELVAPVKRKEARFERITDVSTVDIKLHTLFPAKGFLFKKKETILRFDSKIITTPAPIFDKKQKVFIGLKRCDLNSIKRLDMMFQKEIIDPYYNQERERSILIGYHCLAPADEYCFCSSIDLIDYYDLMLYERDDAYLVEIGSEKGKNFVDRYRKYFWDTDQFIRPDERKIETNLKLEKLDLEPFYLDPAWKKDVNNCFSCGACNTLCPSCYCFDLYEKVDKNLKCAERVRNWASCQLTCFSKVAGNHVFREPRELRFKHRIYHQLQWFKEKHGMTLCTGCGRCIRGCPTRINFIKTINDMKEI